MSTLRLTTRRSVSPSPSPSFPSPSPALSPDPDHHDDDAEAEASPPSPWFNRLTFSLGCPALPPSPVDSTPPPNTTQTISLYFDAEFVPRDATLYAIFGPRGFVSCTSIPPATFAGMPFTPYTAIENNTVIDFARPIRGSGSVRLASVSCCAAFLLVYTVVVWLFFGAFGRSPPHAPLPVLSSPLPLQANVTNILRLHDEALVPIAVPDDHASSNASSIHLIDLLYKEISNFCLLISEQALDMEAVQYTNRVCGWAHEATGDLRHVWLRASRFHSDSMGITTSHWLESLVSALQGERSDVTDDTNTSRQILRTVSRFLDPSTEQGLLPRSLQKGHAAVEVVLSHLDTLQDEVDRLVTLAHEHNIQPDADAQPPQRAEKPSWAWHLLSRDVQPVIMVTNWTAAAIEGDKVLLAAHASRALARVVQRGADAIAAMRPKATKSEVRFREAEEALHSTSYSLRILLETLSSSDGGPSVAGSRRSAAWNRAVDGLMQWVSSLRRGPPRQDWWQLGTPWLTCGSGHSDGKGPARARDERERGCGCAVCWTLWYVPSVDGMVELFTTKARNHAPLVVVASGRRRRGGKRHGNIRLWRGFGPVLTTLTHKGQFVLVAAAMVIDCGNGPRSERCQQQQQQQPPRPSAHLEVQLSRLARCPVTIERSLRLVPPSFSMSVPSPPPMPHSGLY